MKTVGSILIFCIAALFVIPKAHKAPVRLSHQKESVYKPKDDVVVKRQIKKIQADCDSISAKIDANIEYLKQKNN